MEYVYAAMLLHKAGQDVDEDSVKKVLEAAGVEADSSRIKALIASLDGVDIEEAIESAAVAPAAAAPAQSGGDQGGGDESAEGESDSDEGGDDSSDEGGEEDEGKSEEEAAEGLGALFG